MQENEKQLQLVSDVVRPENTVKRVPTAVLVGEALQENHYFFDSNRGWILSTDTFAEPELPTIIAARLQSHLESKRVKPVPSITTIIAHLELIQHDLQKAHAVECYEKIQYSPDAKDTFDELARLIAGDNYNPIYPHILRQWIYTVKARIRGKTVTCPIFVIFYGDQGTGKSTFVKRLVSVIPEHKYAFIKDGDKLFNAEKNTQMMLDHLVIHIDELAGVKDADIAKLKVMVDMVYASFVPLYTNSTRRGLVTGTLIGCSNDRVKTIIHHADDIRKWCEVCFYDPSENDPEGSKRERIDGIKSFDYVNLWRSVNECGPEPFSNPEIYSQYLEHVKNTCVSSTPTTDWIDSFIREYAGQLVNKPAMYKNYTLYMDQTHRRSKPMEKGKFYETCKKRGFYDQRTSNERGFKVPQYTPAPDDPYEDDNAPLVLVDKDSLFINGGAQ